MSNRAFHPTGVIASLVMVFALGATPALSGCARAPHSAKHAQRYLQSWVPKKNLRGAQYFAQYPEQINDTVAARLKGMVHGKHARPALEALSASGRDEIGSLLVHLLDDKSYNNVSRAELEALLVHWEEVSGRRSETHAVTAPHPADVFEGDDTVHLKDGGRVVGRLVLENQRLVIVELSDGTLVRIKRAHVAEIVYAEE